MFLSSTVSFRLFDLNKSTTYYLVDFVFIWGYVFLMTKIFDLYRGRTKNTQLKNKLGMGFGLEVGLGDFGIEKTGKGQGLGLGLGQRQEQGRKDTLK